MEENFIKKITKLGFPESKAIELTKNKSINQRLAEIFSCTPNPLPLHIILSQHSSDIHLQNAITNKEVTSEKQIIKILKDCDDLSDIPSFIRNNKLTNEEIERIINNNNKKEALKIINDKGVFNDLKEIINKINNKNNNALIKETKENSEFDWLKEGLVKYLHKPGDNPQLTEEIKEKHLRRTNNKVVTRFPPEPNGYLHIGHAKAMALSFDYAKMHDGLTFLRFDDTNPKNEDVEFYKAIIEDVEWLGYKPSFITASSSYFDQMVQFAYRLIEEGLAYVCHLSSEEIHDLRMKTNFSQNNDKFLLNEKLGGNFYDPFVSKEVCLTNGCLHQENDFLSKKCLIHADRSPFRKRDKFINKALFTEMLEGKWKEGKAVLRLKMEESNNPFMQDLIIYRVIEKEHPFNNKYKAFPSYDFALCICDSLEDVTHSFCSKEFQTRQISYQWLLNKLKLYKPVQWEFSRLNISNTVLSKRKVNQLVNDKIINSYDDPRLFTLRGLRNRGFTPKSINDFVRRVGITFSESIIDVKLLEQIQRDELNLSAERIICIFNPMKVILGEEVFFINGNDYKSTDDPSFLRLTDNQPVGLIDKCTIKIKEKKENVLICEKTEEKPKKFIPWLNDFVEVKVNLYEHLFKSFNPENDFLSDINKDSHKVIIGYCDRKIINDPIGMRYQFLREGYFIKIKENEFNRIVELKSSYKN